MPDPNYVAPTRAVFRTQLGRALRDTGFTVFSTAIVNDFMVEGLLDLTSFRPVDLTETQEFDSSPVIPANLSYIWQVEMSSSVEGYGNAIIVPYVTGEDLHRNGWDFYGGKLYLSRWWTSMLTGWQQGLADGDTLKVVMSGYRDRFLPDSDDDVLDLLDNTDQYYLGWYCRMVAFQTLNSDRSLYQQWLAATNNTDVSPTQLQGMLSQAQSEVERIRKRNSLQRRVPVVGPQWMD